MDGGHNALVKIRTDWIRKHTRKRPRKKDEYTGTLCGRGEDDKPQMAQKVGN